jgi:hypothetical protein
MNLACEALAFEQTDHDTIDQQGREKGCDHLQGPLGDVIGHLDRGGLGPSCQDRCCAYACRDMFYPTGWTYLRERKHATHRLR